MAERTAGVPLLARAVNQTRSWPDLQKHKQRHGRIIGHRPLYMSLKTSPKEKPDQMWQPKGNARTTQKGTSSASGPPHVAWPQALDTSFLNRRGFPRITTPVHSKSQVSLDVARRNESCKRNICGTVGGMRAANKNIWMGQLPVASCVWLVKTQ